MTKAPEDKNRPAEPPTPPKYAVFAYDRRSGARVQITKTRNSKRGANFDKADVLFGTDECILQNRIKVDEVS